MLDKLRAFNTDGEQTEDLIAMLEFAQAFGQIHEEFAEAPEWLTAKISQLRRAIQTRFADARDKEIRKLKSQLEGLKTTEEKRVELFNRLKTLEAVPQ